MANLCTWPHCQSVELIRKDHVIFSNLFQYVAKHRLQLKRSRTIIWSRPTHQSQRKFMPVSSSNFCNQRRFRHTNQIKIAWAQNGFHLHSALSWNCQIYMYLSFQVVLFFSKVGRVFRLLLGTRIKSASFRGFKLTGFFWLNSINFKTDNDPKINLQLVVVTIIKISCCYSRSFSIKSCLYLFWHGNLILRQTFYISFLFL